MAEDIMLVTIEETRPDVLERGRRAMEELEHGQTARATGKRPQWNLEIERIRADRAELRGQLAALEKRRE